MHPDHLKYEKAEQEKDIQRKLSASATPRNKPTLSRHALEVELSIIKGKEGNIPLAHWFIDGEKPCPLSFVVLFEMRH